MDDMGRTVSIINTKLGRSKGKNIATVAVCCPLSERVKMGRSMQSSAECSW
jgi:hypothetical protein